MGFYTILALNISQYPLVDSKLCYIELCGDGVTHRGDGYCGNGACNIFGCNCDDGCIAGNPYKGFERHYNRTAINFYDALYLI